MAISTGAAILGSAAIGALGSKGSKQSGSTQTVQNSEPWVYAQPYLKDLFGRAQTQSFTGQAQPTILAQQMQQQRALSGSPLNRAAQQEAQKTLEGGYLDPYKTGALNDVMGLARNQINSQFGGDNFGNSAHQEWLQRGLLSASMPYASQAYNSERQRQTGAAALAPSLANQDYTDISQLSAVGQQQQDFPWQQLQRYQQAISGAGGGTSTTSQPYFTNPGASLMGGALGGLALYNGMNQGGLLGGAQSGGGSPLSMYGDFPVYG